MHIYYVYVYICIFMYIYIYMCIYAYLLYVYTTLISIICRNVDSFKDTKEIFFLK